MARERTISMGREPLPMSEDLTGNMRRLAFERAWYEVAIASAAVREPVFDRHRGCTVSQRGGARSRLRELRRSCGS